VEDSRLTSECVSPGSCADQQPMSMPLQKFFREALLHAKRVSPIRHMRSTTTLNVFLPEVNTNGALVAPVLSKEAAKP